MEKDIINYPLLIDENNLILQYLMQKYETNITIERYTPSFNTISNIHSTLIDGEILLI